MKRWVAVTCTHGRYVSPAVTAELWAFLKDYKPDLRIHLGDVWDTSAWRAGARGTADEGLDLSADFEAGASFLRRYEPHIVFLGNHDWRPYRFTRSPNAIVRRAAQACVDEIECIITRELVAELVPYRVMDGWRMIGDTAFGHGYMYGENAVRDTAEMLGRPIVMGHVHTITSQPGRVLGAPTGRSAGLIADIRQLEYAHGRRNTLRWQNGWLYGEYDTQKTITQEYRSREGVGRDIATALAAASPRDQAAGRDDVSGCRGGHPRVTCHGRASNRKAARGRKS